MTFIYSQDELYMIGSGSNHGSVRRLYRDNAAKKFFDLLAMTPYYHFDTLFPFDPEEIPLLHDYTIRIKRENPPENDPPKTETRILQVQLLKKTNKEPILLRSVRYYEKEAIKSAATQLRTLRFTEPDVDEFASMTITTIEYNLGLPDFLFEIPKVQKEPKSPNQDSF